MSIQITYTKARANLAKLLDEVTSNQEIVLINRRKSESVAMIAASELSSLLEVYHLLRSPKNAERLLRALNRAQTKKLPAQSIDELREEIGIEKK
jgi:antitoxin YefM